MGAFFSSADTKIKVNKCYELIHAGRCKRPRMSPCLENENSRLIPSLPDEISFQILARLPRICYLNLKLVSRGWRAALMTSDIFQLRRELGVTEEWLYILVESNDDMLNWYALDPLSKKWQKLPPIPCVDNVPNCAQPKLWLWSVVKSTVEMASTIKNWFGQKGNSSVIPFCGSSMGVVDGCLYVLGGFSKASAIRCVWRYDPRRNSWNQMSSMNTCRAYCKTGFLKNKLYVVGGVSRGREGLTPLRSAEAFDPSTGMWAEVPSMPFARAQDLPSAIMADVLKPIATGMTSYQGKLCVPQSLYSWPFFVDAGGEMYDPDTNVWTEMPTGMGEGWPARQAGTKLSAVVQGELYALDPSSSMDSGKIKLYDSQEDMWRVVGKVPIHDYADSECPYLLAGFHGKLHVITKSTSHELAVLQADLQKQGNSFTSDGESIWKVIATRDLGRAKLISCQVLDV